MALPHVGIEENVLRITCGSTICEVAGTLPGTLAGFGRTIDGRPVPPPPTGSLEKLGLKNGVLEKLGLENETGNFIAGRGKSDPFVFLVYYSRRDGASKWALRRMQHSSPPQ